MNIKINIKLLLVGILALSQATDCSKGATLQEKEVEHAAAEIPLDLDLVARIKAMEHPETGLTERADELLAEATTAETNSETMRLLSELLNVMKLLTVTNTPLKNIDKAKEASYLGAILKLVHPRIVDPELREFSSKARIEISSKAGKTIESRDVTEDDLFELVYLLKLHLCGQTAKCDQLADWLLEFQGTSFHRKMATVIRTYDRANEETRAKWPLELGESIEALKSAIKAFRDTLTPMNRKLYDFLGGAGVQSTSKAETHDPKGSQNALGPIGPAALGDEQARTPDTEESQDNPTLTPFGNEQAKTPDPKNLQNVRKKTEWDLETMIGGFIVLLLILLVVVACIVGVRYMKK